MKSETIGTRQEKEREENEGKKRILQQRLAFFSARPRETKEKVDDAILNKFD
jgi:hypothetical protein